MTSKPLVSVVMPILNEERFVSDAIESVLRQTFHAWELLIVDDGSTDRSPDIVDQYAASDLRIHALRHSRTAHHGTSASRNLALSVGAGEFVAFLDGDDVWEPTTLARLVEMVEANRSAAMAYGSTLWWFSWRGSEWNDRADFSDEVGKDIAERVILPPKLAFRFLLDGGTLPCLCSLIVRRDVLDLVGGFVDSFDGPYDDQVLLFKTCIDHPVHVTNDVLSRYRRHPDSIYFESEASGRSHADRLVFLTWLQQYLAQHGKNVSQLAGLVGESIKKTVVDVAQSSRSSPAEPLE